MLQRVGMNDEVERAVAVGQAMNVYLWVFDEDMPIAADGG